MGYLDSLPEGLQSVYGGSQQLYRKPQYTQIGQTRVTSPTRLPLGQGMYGQPLPEAPQTPQYNMPVPQQQVQPTGYQAYETDIAQAGYDKYKSYQGTEYWLPNRNVDNSPLQGGDIYEDQGGGKWIWDGNTWLKTEAKTDPATQSSWVEISEDQPWADAGDRAGEVVEWTNVGQMPTSELEAPIAPQGYEGYRNSADIQIDIDTLQTSINTFTENTVQPWAISKSSEMDELTTKHFRFVSGWGALNRGADIFTEISNVLKSGDTNIDSLVSEFKTWRTQILNEGNIGSRYVIAINEMDQYLNTLMNNKVNVLQGLTDLETQLGTAQGVFERAETYEGLLEQHGMDLTEYEQMSEDEQIEWLKGLPEGALPAGIGLSSGYQELEGLVSWQRQFENLVENLEAGGFQLDDGTVDIEGLRNSDHPFGGWLSTVLEESYKTGRIMGDIVDEEGNLAPELTEMTEYFAQNEGLKQDYMDFNRQMASHAVASGKSLNSGYYSDHVANVISQTAFDITGQVSERIMDDIKKQYDYVANSFKSLLEEARSATEAETFGNALSQAYAGIEEQYRQWAETLAASVAETEAAAQGQQITGILTFILNLIGLAL